MANHTRLMALIATLGLTAAAANAAPTPSDEMIFQGACATCHAAGSPRVLAGQKLLPDTTQITGDDPTRAIRLVLHGHFPPPEQRGAWMPSFGSVLSDAQIADVLNWLRQSAGRPPWPDLPHRVQTLRASAPESRR